MADFWLNHYEQTLEHKAHDFQVAEQALWSKWIKPTIGDKVLVQLAPFDLERMKNKMLKAGKSPSTIKYAMAVVSQVWNLARRDGFVVTDSPTRRVKLPRVDNRRDRFLTGQEQSTPQRGPSEARAETRRASVPSAGRLPEGELSGDHLHQRWPL